MQDWFSLIIAIALLGLLGGIALLWHRQSLARLKLEEERTSALNRLLEKAGSAEEVAAFLKSEAGRRAFATPRGGPRPSVAVLRFLQLGSGLLVFTVAIFHRAHRLDACTDINYVRQAIEMRYWGELLVGCGAAFLVVAGVTYLAGRRLHLINGTPPRDGEPDGPDR